MLEEILNLLREQRVLPTRYYIATGQLSLIARLIGPVVLPEAEFRPGRLTELPGQ